MPIGDLPQKNALTANLYRALALVWKRKTIARIDLAAELGLNKSTITKVINQLLETGIVKESGGVRAQNGAGRKARDLVIDGRAGAVAGIEFRPGCISAVLMDMAGSFVCGETMEPSPEEGILSALDRVISACRAKAEERGLSLTGMGLGIPGIVDAERGVVVRSMPLGIESPLDIGTIASERWGIDCIVENDANCGSWGELLLAERGDQGESNFLFVLIELRQPRLTDDPVASYLSAGFGFVLSGRVYHGAHFGAGEFRSVFQEHKRIHQFSFPEAEFARVAADPNMREQAARELARNVALIANSLDLSEVILCWTPQEWGPEYVEVFSKELANLRAYQDMESPRVRLASAPESPIAWGAACRWFERTFALQERWNEFAAYPRP